jgi:hypothetical protein
MTLDQTFFPFHLSQLPQRSEKRLTLWVRKVNDVAVGLEHVDLLDSLDGLSVQLLQGLLELLVVGARAGGSALDLSPGSTLSTVKSRFVST